MADDSRYVVPTGRGYLATYAVSPNRTVLLSTAALEDDVWTAASRVHVLEHDDGVALVPATETEAATETTDPIAEYALSGRHNGPSIAVGQRAVDALGLESADDVRVYDLGVIADRAGVLLVDAADDPRVTTDREANVEGTR